MRSGRGSASACGFVAFDDAGGVFLVRHSYLPGLHLPGGAVDTGETCREAAIREAREEGGLDFDARPELFHVYRSTAGGRRDHIVVFRGPRVPARRGPRAPGLEIIAAGFHPLDALPPDATAATRRPARRRSCGGGPPADTW